MGLSVPLTRPPFRATLKHFWGEICVFCCHFIPIVIANLLRPLYPPALGPSARHPRLRTRKHLCVYILSEQNMWVHPTALLRVSICVSFSVGVWSNVHCCVLFRCLFFFPPSFSSESAKTPCAPTQKHTCDKAFQISWTCSQSECV